MDRPVFVPNGESVTDTAILLTGTAEEYGIHQRSIQKVQGGYYITDELADAVYGEDGVEQEPEAEAPDDEPEPNDEPEVAPYEEWDYPDLKHEVAQRELDVPDQKKDTLIAALVANDG